MTIYKQRRKLQTLIIGILKDKASLARATVSFSSVRAAVLRATTHDPKSPPSERHVSAILARAGRGPRRSSGAWVNALMDRLGSTGSAVVALKCLVVAHHVLSRGSFVLRDQLSSCPVSGGRNSLNLSAFSDRSDEDTWRLSEWVRWHASVVEQSLAVARVLGYHLHRTSSNKLDDDVIRSETTSEILAELDALEEFVERVSHAPESFLGLLKNDLAYEVSRLVHEDYKVVQREILRRVNELGDRISSGLSRGELTRFVSGLKRMEFCKERLVSMYLKKKRDDDFWGIIGILKINIVEIMIEKKLLSYDHEIIVNEFSNNPFFEPERLFLLPNYNGLTYTIV